MNDFDRYRRCSPLGSLQHYSWSDRAMPMAVSHAMRSDVRSCPTRQTRNVPPPEPEHESSNGQPRRRIAVANCQCARCRKRKIRCSGDPGNNTGCQNCRAAGADISQCQFHRVGSYVPGPQIYTYPSGMSSSPSLPMGGYHAPAGDYSYSTHPKSLLSARTFPNYTHVGYGDESPTESYGYQPLPMPGGDIFGGFLSGAQDPVRSWTAMSQKQTTPSTLYIEEPAPVSYSGLQLPYLNNTPVSRQPTVAAENMSAFSMNSLQSSLASPSGPPHPSLPSNLEHRHLPMPTAVRMPVPPSAEFPLKAHASTAVSNATGLPYTKPAVMWNPETNTHDSRQAISNATSSGQMANAPESKSGVSSLQEAGVISFVPVANSSPDSSSNPGSSTVYTPSSMSGATPSSLDEKYATSAANSSQPSTSSSREGGLPRSDSTTSLGYYCTDSSSNKRNGPGEQSSHEGSLVSGQRYAPLQPQSQHATVGLEPLRRDSFEHSRPVPNPRASISSLSDRRY